MKLCNGDIIYFGLERFLKGGRREGERVRRVFHRESIGWPRWQMDADKIGGFGNRGNRFDSAPDRETLGKQIFHSRDAHRSPIGIFNKIPSLASDRGRDALPPIAAFCRRSPGYRDFLFAIIASINFYFSPLYFFRQFILSRLDQIDSGGVCVWKIEHSPVYIIIKLNLIESAK